MHPLLSKEDRAFWDENGYVIIHNAVPPENIKAAENAIWKFLEMQPDDRESWYPDPPRLGIGVKMHHHQVLWNNRQSPRVHQAFAEIWGTEKLWVSFDQCSMNPPLRPHLNDGGKLHWDTPLEPPIPFCCQGMLYLTDVEADGAAFTCVPGFHLKLEAWLESLPPDADPRKQDLMSLGAIPVPGKVGDLIIWHHLLPHAPGVNTADQPRVVQYISMFPAQEEDEAFVNYRINAWKNRLAGGGHSGSRTELEKGKEYKKGQTAELSPLGRKLLGLDRWG